MKLRERQLVIGGIFVLITFIFIGRLIQMQLFSSEWKEYAARLTEETERLEPARGLMLDRNGQILLNNMAGYDIWFTPRKCRTAGGLDTLAFAQILGITRPELEREFRRAEAYASYRPSIIYKQLPAEHFARIAGELYRFPGAEVRRRTIRTNPTGLASHLVGEYREVDQNDMATNPNYRLGDYKGKSGLELQWDQALQGKRGIRHHIVDIRNDYRAPAQEGLLDTLPTPGLDIQLTLDLDLQAYSENIMANKRGAIVAIEPSTGEVLAMVSAPSYATDLLTGRERGSNYDSLLNHPRKPLFNRTLRATYRPGSIFKMIQGLIALEKGVIRPSSRITCDRNIIGCHGSHTLDNLEEAIAHSCNPYFHEVMKRMIQDGSSGSSSVTPTKTWERGRSPFEPLGWGQTSVDILLHCAQGPCLTQLIMIGCMVANDGPIQPSIRFQLEKGNYSPHPFTWPTWPLFWPIEDITSRRTSFRAWEVKVNQRKWNNDSTPRLIRFTSKRSLVLWRRWSRRMMEPVDEPKCRALRSAAKRVRFKIQLATILYSSPLRQRTTPKSP